MADADQHLIRVGKGNSMPSPRNETLTADLLRAYTEELRECTSKVLENTMEVSAFRAETHQFRADLTGLREALHRLTDVIQGGSGQPGLMTTAAVTEDRLGRIEDQLSSLNMAGTPASHATLEVVKQKQEDLLRRMAEAEQNGKRDRKDWEDSLRRHTADADRRANQGSNRGWQVTNTIIALLALLAAAALVVVDVVKR